jgi:hypothetical protein
MDGADVRKVMLELIKGMSASSEGAFGRNDVLTHTTKRVGAGHDQRLQRLVLDGWDDLYRSGIISWGLNTANGLNSGSDWAHLTVQGAEILKNLSRDSGNPHGYRAAIDEYVRDLPVVVSYLAEALDAFNKGSIKATAVMIGAAAESMNLSVRDKLKERMLAGGKTPPKAMDDFRIAEVLRGTEKELTLRAKEMPKELRERFDSYWPAWTGLFRMRRARRQRSSARNPRGRPPRIRIACADPVLDVTRWRGQIRVRGRTVNPKATSLARPTPQAR